MDDDELREEVWAAFNNWLDHAFAHIDGIRGWDYLCRMETYQREWQYAKERRNHYTSATGLAIIKRCLQRMIDANESGNNVMQS